MQYKDLDITLLEVATHSHIVTGGYYSYYSKPGETFIDVTALVRNEKSLPVYVMMNDIYVVEETGDAWYANFSGVMTVELEEAFNPMGSLKFDETPDEKVVKFEEDTYLRLVYYVRQGQELVFGIEDSPQFAISVE